jgi:hypothetical protein
MEKMPLTSLLVTAGALWALWLWRKHKLTGEVLTGEGLTLPEVRAPTGPFTVPYVPGGPTR